jgi:flagellar hook-length control protein FliK
MNALATSLSLAPKARSSTPSGSTPGPQAAAHDGANTQDFARCLDRARDSARPRADDAPARNREDAAPRTREDAASRAPGRNATDAGARARDGAGKARDTADADATGAQAGVDPVTSPAVEDTPAADASDGLASAATDDDTAHDPSLLVPVWTPPAAAPTAAGASIAVATAATDEASGLAGVESLPAAAGTAGNAAASPASRAAPAGDDASPASPAAAASLPPGAPAAATMAHGLEVAANALTAAHGGQVAAAERKAAPGDAAPTLPASASAVATVATGALVTPPPKANESLLATAAVHAPIDTPGFAPALATQVRWWAQGGVQQAQLTLNPAEMGPVAVRIVLDGREARIDFSADMAATRGAIEAALPVLAGTLDDSGLKLTGGGVHDGAAGRQPDWHAHGVTQRTAQGAALHDSGAPGSGSATRTTAARGLVDLVA